ncbi:hypothetical protein MASR2M78_18250 [Treponema sp.]
MKKIAMLTLAILFSAGFAFAVPESFSQEYILSKVQSHELVQQAQVNLAIKTGIQTVEAGWKGAQVTLTPAFTYDDLTGEFDLRETAIGGDLLFPLGISKADKERKIQTAELAAIAEAELSDAYGKAYTDLFALYGTAYSTQQNVELAEAEAELARLRLASISQKIARGLAALSEQTDAEADIKPRKKKHPSGSGCSHHLLQPSLCSRFRNCQTWTESSKRIGTVQTTPP